MSKSITVRCDCGKEYELTHSKIPMVMEYKIAYAKCPHCGLYRDPKVANSIPLLRCECCHYKHLTTDRELRRGICDACYVADWRRKKLPAEGSFV